MFDESMVGATGAPFTMPVELGKIREFTAATHARAPEYQTVTAPVPPTFLMSYGFWTTVENMAWGENPPSFENLLHGAQEFTFHGPPPAAGDRLSCQMRIDRVYRKAGKGGGTMRFIETVVEFRDHATKELRAESRATLIQTPDEGDHR
jgi:hypothetical protein